MINLQALLDAGIDAEVSGKVAEAMALDAAADAVVLKAKDDEIARLNEIIARLDADLAHSDALVSARDATIVNQVKFIDSLQSDMGVQLALVEQLKKALAECQAGTPPVDPPPVEPPTGTFWQGLNTVWPTATTTGPRIVLTAAPSGAVSGKHVGKRFTGTVKPANGTEFEDCEFVGNGGWAIDGDGRKFTVDHCRFVGKGGPAAILGNATVLACDISGWEDAIKTQGSGWVIRGNYIHGPFKTATSHNDGIQIQWSNSNGLVEQNRIEWTDTSEVFCQKLTGTIDNITVRHNWMGGSDHPLRIEAGCTNCKAYENVIKKGHWGYYDLNSTVDHYGNIDSVTGATIP